MSPKESRNNLLPVEHELRERVRWFVRLRWLAGVSVLATGGFLRWGLGWPLSLGVEVVGLGVILYNLLFHGWLHRLEPLPHRPSVWLLLANLQISVDYIALVVLFHFTGGLFSPLLPFAAFHIVIASLLLRRRDVFLQAALVISLVGLLGWAEAKDWLPAETLGGRLARPAEGPPERALLTFLGFSALVLITAYLASTLGYALRWREQQLLKMQRDLQEAYQRLEAMDRAKSHFTLMVTHELRSPVAALQSLLEVLRQGYAGELPRQARELVERAARRTDTLVELVNQLLDLAKERVELTPERSQPIPVEHLFRQMEEAYRSPAEAQGVRFLVEYPSTPLAVRGEPDELNKMLSNLVGNAVKYTLSGGQVSLRAWRERDEVVLEVRDTGIGIPEEEQPRLFTEFFRASNAKRVVEQGTGLGLAIVQRIVNAHRGRIRFASKEGQGTTFWVSLPSSLPSPVPEEE